MSRPTQASTCRCTGESPPNPRGPWLRSELCCSIHHRLIRPHAQSRRHVATRFYTYKQRLRCAGAPRRPAGLPYFRLPYFPCIPSTLPRWSAVSFRCTRTGFRLPRICSESPPATTRLCQQFPTGHLFRGCIVLFMLRPVCLPSPPDWLRQDEATCTSPCLLRYLVTPAFAHPLPDCAGNQARWANGNVSSSELSPDKLRQLVRLHTNDQ